jgi:hypothetical protein
MVLLSNSGSYACPSPSIRAAKVPSIDVIGPPGQVAGTTAVTQNDAI